MGFLNSIMPEYLLLKNNVANLAVLHCGFLNISSKVIVNWWLKFENFLKAFLESICKAPILQPGKVRCTRFFTTLHGKLDGVLQGAACERRRALICEVGGAGVPLLVGVCNCKEMTWILCEH